MIYSKSSQYAIRAIAYLATLPPDRLCPLETIATSQGIPQHFLAKIMQRLARKRIVKSVKGTHGGFALNYKAEDLTLLVIVDAIDDISVMVSECVLGNPVCSETLQCSLHQKWIELKERQLQFLQGIRISDVVPK